MTNQDLILISTLQYRYNLSKQAVYDRINQLKITPPKKGRITLEQLELMDDLERFRQRHPNRPIADYPGIAEVTPTERMPDEKDNFQLSTGRLDDSLDTAEPPTVSNFIQLVREIAFAIKQNEPAESVSPLRELEEVSQNGWLLTTSQVKHLIGVKPRTKRSIDFKRGSFVFSKIPIDLKEPPKAFMKIGNQTAWKVTKLDI